MTYKELFKFGLDRLGFDKKRDVEELLCYAAKITLAELLANKDKETNDVAVSIYNKAINECLHGKPLAYIVHKVCFYGYDFFVNEGCLIPRVDSEVLIENILKKLAICHNTELDILDACCGSGCLGIALAKELKQRNVVSRLTLIDKSQNAMQVAKLNCAKHNIHAKYVIADVLSYGFGEGKYDVIVCNPPYIETNEIEYLDKQVKDYEPRMALDGGSDGLKFYRFLSKKVHNNLKEKGFSIFEIGYNQGKTAKDIFLQQNLSVEIIKDYGNNDRALITLY